MPKNGEKKNCIVANADVKTSNTVDVSAAVPANDLIKAG